MISLACLEKVDLSTRLDIRSGHTEVAFAANVSVVAASSCAVDGLNPTVANVAVNTFSSGNPPAANKHFIRRAGPSKKTLDPAKNSL